MNDLLKSIPLIQWMKWMLHYKKLKRLTKPKSIKLGIGTYIYNSKIGNYNVYNKDILVSNSQINDFVYIGSNSRIVNCEIGKFCSIGPDVKIGLGNHPIDFVSTFPAFYSTKQQCGFTFSDRDYFSESQPIMIGNDVWIGSNALIMDNVRIGDGAIIASGAIVTKDVEDYQIVGGIPAKKIKSRFSEDDISYLKELCWWNKDFMWLQDNFIKFHDIERIKTV